MADHHDMMDRDILDSALDRLRSRQWAGPSTNPSLERLFMRSGKSEQRLKFRLILGVGAALVGCGAVAAGVRPAWNAVFGPQERVVAKAEAPAPVEPAKVAAPAAAPAPSIAKIQTPAPRTVQAAAPAAAPAPAAPRAMAVVPQPAEPPETEPEPTVVAGLQLDGVATWESGPADMDALAWALLDQYMLGDESAGEALFSLLSGETPAAGTWIALAPVMVVDGEEMVFEFAATVTGTALSDGEFEIVLDGQQFPEGESVILLETEELAPAAGVIRLQVVPTVQGVPLPKP